MGKERPWVCPECFSMLGDWKMPQAEAILVLELHEAAVHGRGHRAAAQARTVAKTQGASEVAGRQQTTRKLTRCPACEVLVRIDKLSKHLAMHERRGHQLKPAGLVPDPSEGPPVNMERRASETIGVGQSAGTASSSVQGMDWLYRENRGGGRHSPLCQHD